MDNTMRVAFMLADAAQVVGGKLYLLGGAWNITGPGGQPIRMALAVNIGVPWNETNQKHKFEAVLLTEDGQPALDPQGQPVRVDGEFEVGRPAGITPGSTFNSPIAIELLLPLPVGAYRWEVSIDGTMLAAESFTVVDRPVARSG